MKNAFAVQGAKGVAVRRTGGSDELGTVAFQCENIQPATSVPEGEGVLSISPGRQTSIIAEGYC